MSKALRRWIDRGVDLATMPIYVRAGAIIPMDPVKQYMSEPVSEPTTLQIYPGADGQFNLYDDDGETLAILTERIRRRLGLVFVGTIKRDA